MIQVITAGDPYGGTLAVWYVLQCPAALDLKSEWEKYEAGYKEECGKGPMRNPEFAEWHAKCMRILQGRYRYLHPQSTEIPKGYLLTHCFVAQMIRDHGCEQLEFVEICTEE